MPACMFQWLSPVPCLCVLCSSVFPDMVTRARRGWCKSGLVLIAVSSDWNVLHSLFSRFTQDLLRFSGLLLALTPLLSVGWCITSVVLWINYVPILMWRSADDPSVTWSFTPICQTLVLCLFGLCEKFQCLFVLIFAFHVNCKGFSVSQWY